MKSIVYIFIVGMITSMLSCAQTNEKNEFVAEVADTFMKRSGKPEMKEERLERIKHMEDEYALDSIRLDIVLNKALEMAHKNIRATDFHEEFEMTLDSIFNVKTTMAIRSFFSPEYRHLMIHREGPNNMMIDIYLIKDKKILKVLSHDQWSMTYVSDTLKDINGDGYKDFVVNWYGANGCCLKGFGDVYLYQSDIGSFTKQFEFINPTFLPKEKIVRGVCYGHPGETEMYTYKWKDESIDTLEYIRYEKNDKGEKTGKFVTYKNKGKNDASKIIKRFDVMPKEYTIIEGYDWFEGDGF